MYVCVCVCVCECHNVQNSTYQKAAHKQSAAASSDRGSGRGRVAGRGSQSGMEESATLWSSSVASAENKIKVKHSIFN